LVSQNVKNTVDKLKKVVFLHNCEPETPSIFERRQLPPTLPCYQHRNTSRRTCGVTAAPSNRNLCQENGKPHDWCIGMLDTRQHLVATERCSEPNNLVLSYKQQVQNGVFVGNYSCRRISDVL